MVLMTAATAATARNHAVMCGKPRTCWRVLAWSTMSRRRFDHCATNKHSPRCTFGTDGKIFSCNHRNLRFANLAVSFGRRFTASAATGWSARRSFPFFAMTSSSSSENLMPRTIRTNLSRSWSGTTATALCDPCWHRAGENASAAAPDPPTPAALARAPRPRPAALSIVDRLCFTAPSIPKLVAHGLFPLQVTSAATHRFISLTSWYE